VKLECIANTGAAVEKYLGTLFLDPGITFHVTIGQVYPVLGLELLQGNLHALIPDDSDYRRPQWLPLELFRVCDPMISPNWFFKAYDRDSEPFRQGFQARWGYQELVESDVHRDGLGERMPSALSIFQQQLDATMTGFDDS